MANPLVLFNNVFETSTGTFTNSTGVAASGFPIENVLDWRVATAFRWKSGNSAVLIQFHIDLEGVADLGVDTLGLAGHNLGDQVNAQLRVQSSEDGAAWTTRNTAYQNVTTNFPWLQSWTQDTANGGVHRYWKVQLKIDSDDASNRSQIGSLVLGKRIDFESGPQARLDPYGSEAIVDQSRNENGSPLGVNVRFKKKMFQLSYGAGSDPGFTKSGFFDPSSGLTWDGDFQGHAIDNAKPFYFAWNTDEQSDGVYICTTNQMNMPFVGTTLRRGLNCVFEAHREVS